MYRQYIYSLIHSWYVPGGVSELQVPEVRVGQTMPLVFWSSTAVQKEMKLIF